MDRVSPNSGFEIGRARLLPSPNDGKKRLSRSFALPKAVLEIPSIVFSLVLLFGGLANAADVTMAETLLYEPHVLITAHRGDSQRFPENTLPAFASAVKTGADLVELDYRHSADGFPIVIHDETLDRTTNAVRVYGRTKIPVAGTRAREFAQLDAGSWFHSRFADVRVPTLEQALDVIQQGSVTLVERKSGDAATCVRLLSEKRLLDKVIVQSFDWEYVADCHRLAPRLVLAALGSKELTNSKLDDAQQTGAKIIAWNQKDIDRKHIDAIHRRGLRAWVYTVNEPKRALELVDWGIDGIITDIPATMLEVAGRSKSDGE